MADSTEDKAAAGTAPETTAPNPGMPKDASRRDIILYAVGNIEAAVANQFWAIFGQIMVVGFLISPLVLGLVASVQTLFTAFVDPVMAYITDNTKSRWGRRRPYILAGGVLRVVMLVPIMLFLPSGDRLTPNPVMEAQRIVNDGVKEISTARTDSLAAFEQLQSRDQAIQAKARKTFEGISKRCETGLKQINGSLPVLEQDLAVRQTEAASRLAEAKALRDGPAAAAVSGSQLRDADGIAEFAQERVQTAQKLVTSATDARREAIASEQTAAFALSPESAGRIADPVARAAAQALADELFVQAELPPMDIFSVAAPPSEAQIAAPKKGLLSGVTEGFRTFADPKNAAQRPLIYFFLAATVVFTVLSSVHSAPYWAMGIEIAPSYDGRTRVVTYRSVIDKIAGLIMPFVPVFCFSLYFFKATQGLFWVAIFACVVGIPTTVLMCWYVKEPPIPARSGAKKKKQSGLLLSMWEVAHNRHFLKVFVITAAVGVINGVFMQFSGYLNIYWVMGSALAGAKLSAMIAVAAWAICFINLPLINWACKKYQKHNVLMAAIAWMALGTVINWWALNPAHPEYQFVLPFFFSVGISMTYTVLPTMMADVTDVDELYHHVRREGMFGAVMSFLNKLMGTLVPVVGGAILVASGFDPLLEYRQSPDAIFNMRILASFVPGALLLSSILLIWRYPLTRERIDEIKAELARRHTEAEGSHPAA